MASKKIIKRVEDLIRLANSTTFEGEKETAAIEAVRLIGEHKIQIGEESNETREISTRRKTPRATPAPPVRPPIVYSSWCSGFAERDEICALCGGIIRAGWEYVAADDGRFLHEDWPACANGH